MQGQTNKKILAAKLQRRLRNAPTDAESKLWQRLRHRQLDHCKFRRQHPFGDYILDFVCLERKIVIELDGAQHADRLEYDRQRTRFLERSGFTVLRFWNNEVFENLEDLLEVVLQTLRDRATPSPPNVAKLGIHASQSNPALRSCFGRSAAREPWFASVLPHPLEGEG
ncbi:MAG: endonuclease domain-containing protein [Rudaea sp.]|nr:endonuclease domain-containing protein [Rudaea sp.]MBN8887826.1 endonuclease domain-containing protein [Rudaea sp.]MBR0346590.1 endonuclease domain-containing protein [Rudaea sp.]